MKKQILKKTLGFACALFFGVSLSSVWTNATTLSENQIGSTEKEEVTVPTQETYNSAVEDGNETSGENLNVESSYGTLVEKGNYGRGVYDYELHAYVNGSNVQWAVYNSGTAANPDYTLVISGTGQASAADIIYNQDDPANSTLVAPYAKYSQYITKGVVENGVTDTGYGTFAFLKNLKTVSLPSSLSEITYAAFEGSGIEEIYLPDSITTIRDGAFTYCSNLKKIRFSNNLVLIENFAFAYCIGLEEIELPDSLKEIPSGCFTFCSNLKKVKLPRYLETIGSSAFGMNEKLCEIDIPDTVRKIGEFSFQAAAFSYVNLPEGLQTIEEMSFNYVQMEYIEIPSTVTTIETRAFSHNHALKTLVIPESVTSIGELLFREDGSLTDLYLPPSITYIPDNIFEYCSQNITIHGVPGSAAEAFANKYSNLTFVGDYHNAPKNTMKSVRQFVERLYEVCLDRSSDTAGMNDWAGHLADQSISGSEAAYGFVFSPEFKSHNYCNECYVEHLYRAFLGRESDPPGKADWIKQLESGKTREEVFNGFALSVEFSNLCKSYGIELGKGISVPKYGTIPTGRCSGCNAEDGVTIFVKRLYRVCLDREADSSGLNDWCNQLWSRKKGGTDVAYGFVFSEEFQNKNLSDEEYVEYLYKVFFDRGSDPEGKRTWLGKLQSGSSRKEVFDGFTGSKEFANLCNKCGIRR